MSKCAVLLYAASGQQLLSTAYQNGFPSCVPSGITLSAAHLAVIPELILILS